ncbi:MAG: restriction endonuclease subunit S [Candidatus Gracilibacteria bacterium]
MKLKKFLSINKETINIDNSITYKIAGVQSFGKGIVLRREEKGVDLTMRKYQVIKENQLMWCKVDNKNGAFGITKKEHVGALASTNMTLGNIDTTKVNPNFLELLFSVKSFYEFINSLCTGATNRKYLKIPDLIDRVKIPNLNLEEQNFFLENYDKFKFDFDNLGKIINKNLSYIKQLKQAILQEAIEGKLTKSWRENNPNIDGAKILLEKIQKEKDELVKEKKLKKQEKLKEITNDEIPFEIPENWIWCRLGEIVNIFGGNNFDKDNFNKKSGTKVVKITNVGVHNFIETQDFLPISFLEKYSNFIIKENDILLALTRPFIKDGLKVCLSSLEYNDSLLNQRVAVIKNIFNLDYNYQYLFLKTGYILNKYQSKFDGVSQQPNLKIGDVSDLLFPLPPLEEQKEIVKKVDELMKSCDLLEKQSLETKKNSENLMKSVLSEVFNQKEEDNEKRIHKGLDYFKLKQETGVIIRELQKTGYPRGEMAIAKYFYLLEILGIKSDLVYERNPFGPYSSEIKKVIYSKKDNFFATGPKGTIILGKNSSKLFDYKSDFLKEIEKGMNYLLDNLGLAKAKSEYIEILATVCKVIQDIKSLDIDKIIKELKIWKVDKNGTTKWDKFKDVNYTDLLNLITKEGWNKKLLAE